GGHMRIRRHAGRYQHRVVGGGVEPAPGLIGDAGTVQFAAALHRERRRQVDPARARWDEFAHRVRPAYLTWRSISRAAATSGAVSTCTGADSKSPLRDMASPLA